MKYEIQWSEASVNNEQLSVPVSVDEPATLSRWHEIFNQIVRQELPGVPYSLAATWGEIVMNSHAVITVDGVSERVAASVRAHLEAAVDRTTEAYEQELREQARQEEAARVQAANAAEQDQKLTDLFRGEN
jgi:hypothetical protein